MPCPTCGQLLPNERVTSLAQERERILDRLAQPIKILGCVCGDPDRADKGLDPCPGRKCEGPICGGLGGVHGDKEVCDECETGESI